MKSHRSKILFVLFLVSGFCGLLYQTVWLRLGLASFGVITPVVSVIVSVFMLGLGLGSWLGGRCIGPLRSKTGFSAITFYGLTEFIIGLGAFGVPAGFAIGSKMLLLTGESNSPQYLVGSAIVIAASIFVWSTAMGTTFPFVMAFVEEFEDADKRSFSLLYLANVAGAVLGTLTTVLVLIELFGLHKTLAVAAYLNFLIGAIALFWGVRRGRKRSWMEADAQKPVDSNLPQRAFSLAVLFVTGFVSMAMEVVWTRAYTVLLGTMVYSFAKLLSTYLLTTCAGSYLYRRDCARKTVASKELLLMVTAVCALIPVIIGDPRLSPLAQAMHIPLQYLVLLSIAPFCCSLGYLTPLLIDDLAQGDPVTAGKAYAVNIVGCIVGPLLAGYALLPALGARLSLVILAVPLLVFGSLVFRKLTRPVQISSATVSALLLCGAILSRGWEEGANIKADRIVVRRDYAATVVSYDDGIKKHLLVNGIGITCLTPITKYMAHLPLAFARKRPESAMVICFGMGTTYRSLLSWGIHATAVELVPSVKDAFGYYFDDAKAVLQNPNGRIVIDDGRRFLARTKEKFDVITIDPPPPIEAAGSSLLYSEDFYKLLKQHLKPGGIFQQWIPSSGRTKSAVTRSLFESFPYVKAFESVEGWGCHFLASDQPIEGLTADQFISKLPEAAKRDLLEWCPGKNPLLELREGIDAVLLHQVDLRTILDHDSSIRITDDRPFNEYFWLRKHFSPNGE